MSDAPPIVVARDGPVTRVTLNRPERRNALNVAMVKGLTDAVARANRDEGCRVMLLSGAGPDFCAGADLHELAAAQDAPLGAQLDDADRLGELFIRMRTARVPLIAAVRGRVLAGGCGLASACDLVFAATGAHFGYPEVGIGFVPAMVMAMLRRNVGEKRAFELVATGRLLDAAEAEGWGLVNRVLSPEALDDEAAAFAASLADRSATAIGLCKSLLYAQDDMGFAAGVRTGAEVNVLARLTADAREGIAGFAGRGGG